MPAVPEVAGSTGMANRPFTKRNLQTDSYNLHGDSTFRLANVPGARVSSPNAA